MPKRRKAQRRKPTRANGPPGRVRKKQGTPKQAPKVKVTWDSRIWGKGSVTVVGERAKRASLLGLSAPIHEIMYVVFLLGTLIGLVRHFSAA